MAWQEIERERPARNIDLATFGISSRWGAQVSLREPLIVQLGWKVAQPLRLYRDIEAGRIKLEWAANGQYRAGRLHKGGALIRLGILEGLRLEKLRNMPVLYVVEGRDLIFDIPKQMRGDFRPQTVTPSRPQTPPDQSVLTEKPAFSGHSGIRRNSDARVGEIPRALPLGQIEKKVDVTSKFFNDPKKPPQMASGVRGQRS